MIDNITKGTRIQGLLVYLFGPGEHHEDHVNQRLVAGWDGLAVENEGLAPAEVFALAAEMDRPRVAHLGEDVPANYVWHCSLANRQDEDELTDEQWGRIARQVIEEMGFADCRWVAVRHADNHIHLAVTRVTESGKLVSLNNDFHRMKAICERIEVAWKFEHVPDRSRGTRGASRAELDRAARAGHAETARDGLARKLRAAAMVARNESEFVTRARQDGLQLKTRKDEAGRVIGYAVSDPESGPLWYAGRTLAPDLSLPRLRHRWAGLPQPRTAPDDADAPRSGQKTVDGPDWAGEQPVAARARLREQAWTQARAVVDDVYARMQVIPAEDVATWAAAAGEVAGVLAALSARLEQPGVAGPLARAATAMARAAQTDPMSRTYGDGGYSYPPSLGHLWGVSRVTADAQLTGTGTAAMAAMMMSVERMVDSMVTTRDARAQSAQYRQLIAASQALREWTRNPIGPPPPEAALVMPGYRPDPARTPQPPAPTRAQQPRKTPSRWPGRRDRTRGEEDRSR